MNVSSATIEGLEAFETLDFVQRSSLAKTLHPLTFSPGEVIFYKAGNERSVYFLISGRIRVCVMSLGGKEIQFEDIQPGEMFGELAALDGKKRTSDCIALCDVTLGVMSQTDFLSALDIYVGFNRYVMNRLAKMLRKQMGRVFEFSAHTVRDRVRFEIFRIAVGAGEVDSGEVCVDDAPTHSDIASRISTHREAVTREIKNLEREKIITWRPGKHVVHDLRALAYKS